MFYVVDPKEHNPVGRYMVYTSPAYGSRDPIGAFKDRLSKLMPARGLALEDLKFEGHSFDFTYAFVRCTAAMARQLGAIVGSPCLEMVGVRR
jgi:hypothetical protein